jgi:DNA-binding transcriptional ArsR family regulator
MCPTATGVLQSTFVWAPALARTSRGSRWAKVCFKAASTSEGLPKYTFTRICYVEYMKSVKSFEIIAEPNRRAILSLLVSSQQSVGEIERQLRMSQPTVSKHLRVLREAGFVESTVDAQRRLYRLKPEPLQEVDAWLAPFRRFWSAHLDALERHLDHIDQSTPTKRKARRRRRGPNRERDKSE